MSFALIASVIRQQLRPYLLEGPTLFHEDAGIIERTHTNPWASVSELDTNRIMSGDQLILSHQEINQIVS